MRKLIRTAINHLLAVIVVGSVVLGAAVCVVSFRFTDARDAKWESTMAVALTDSKALNGADGNSVDFESNGIAFEAVVVDEVVYAGNRYDAFTDGTTIALSDPRTRVELNVLLGMFTAALAFLFSIRAVMRYDNYELEHKLHRFVDRHDRKVVSA
jgi:hypothetical protein